MTELKGKKTRQKRVVEMGGCHMEEGIREGNLNRLGGGEGVTREHLKEKGSGGQQMPRI